MKLMYWRIKGCADCPAFNDLVLVKKKFKRTLFLNNEIVGELSIRTFLVFINHRRANGCKFF